MLVVTMEIWPFGDKHLRRTLGTLKIVNDGSGDPVQGHYDVILTESRKAEVKSARVEWFERKEGAWKLLTQALLQLVGWAAE